jgi:nucleoside-diphosphate-sugar epimerase
MGTIAVIGAAGFVGTRLVESLFLEGKRDVRAVVRAHRNLARLSRFGNGIAVRLANAEDAGSLKAALDGASVVVNVTTGSPASIVKTTKAIYEACAEAKVKRLIHLSSAVVYGEVTSPSISDDSPPLEGHWMPYARAKAEAEIWLRERLGVAPFEIAVLRPGLIWGVRSPHTLDIVQAILQKRAYLVDGGKGVFNAIYVDNLVAAICTASRATTDVRGFYNVGDAEEVNWRDFYVALAGPLGYDMGQMPSVSGERFPWSRRAVIEYVQALPPVNALYHRIKSQLPAVVKSRLKAMLRDRYNYEETASDYVTRPIVEREMWHLQQVKHKLPTVKAAKQLGFVPPVSFDEGIRRTLLWLASVGYLPAQAAVVNHR